MEKLKLGKGESVGRGEIVPRLQSGDSDCGPAAVWSVLASLGIEMDYDELCFKLGTNGEGTGDVTRIISLFEECGLMVGESDNATVADIETALVNGCYCLIEFQSPESDYHREVLCLERQPDLIECTDCGHYSVVFLISKTPDGRKLMWLMDSMIKDENESGVGVGVRVMDADHFRLRWEVQGEEPGWMLAVKAE